MEQLLIEFKQVFSDVPKCTTCVCHVVKVAVNSELQKLIHGLFNFVIHIELCMHSFSVLYCRVSLTLLPQQIS